MNYNDNFSFSNGDPDDFAQEIAEINETINAKRERAMAKLKEEK